MWLSPFLLLKPILMIWLLLLKQLLLLSGGPLREQWNQAGHSILTLWKWRFEMILIPIFCLKIQRFFWIALMLLVSTCWSLAFFRHCYKCQSCQNPGNRILSITKRIWLVLDVFTAIYYNHEYLLRWITKYIQLSLRSYIYEACLLWVDTCISSWTAVNCA